MIKPWFLNILLAVAVVVAAGRFLDTVGRRTEPPPEVAVSASAPKVRAIEKRTMRKEDFPEIVDKNLFDSKRGKAEPEAAKAPPPPPPAAQPPKATLFGIMVDPEGKKYAFLTDNSAGAGARAKRYREGESLSGAKIKEIREDRVIFAVGSSEHTISLRAPKEGLAAFQPPASTGAVNNPAPGVSARSGRARSRRPAVTGQRPTPRRPAPVRGRQTAPEEGDPFQQLWDEGENPFGEEPFAENPFEENPFVENPFEENPFQEEENPFGGGQDFPDFGNSRGR